MLEKKANDIILLDISESAIFTDFFLICNGENDRQIRALTDGITEDAKKKANIMPWGTEGEPSGGWILVDFGELVVHVFSPEKRNFYNLEELWEDGHVILRMQ